MMTAVGRATVRIDDAAIKARMRDMLAQAWEEGAQCRAQTPPHTSVQGLNPYRPRPA